MAPPYETSSLANPLASADQLETSCSRLDGVPADLEVSIQYAGTRLTQAAGILLRLPQDIIAQAIVIFTRFWIGPEGGSLKEHGVLDISAASMHLITKLSAHPKSPRSILNVYAYLSTQPLLSHPPAAATAAPPTYDPAAHYLPEHAYHARRTALATHEAQLLRTLGFGTHVALPHALCIHYLQALGVAGAGAGSRVAARALAHLNAALLSPQLLYATHAPAALAVAAAYLAAREEGVKLAGGEWWVVFDVGREELGFVVVAMNSMAGFAAEEGKRWEARRVPLTVEEVEAELERRVLLREGE